MEAVRGQKHPSEAKKGMKELIYQKKYLIKVSQQPQKPFSGSNQIWATTSDKKDTSQGPQLSPNPRARLKSTQSGIPSVSKLQYFFSNLNYNSSNLLNMRNLQELVKKAFCNQKLFWPLIVWINCSSDLKIFANSQPSDSNFKSFSRSLERFFLKVG